MFELPHPVKTVIIILFLILKMLMLVPYPIRSVTVTFIFTHDFIVPLTHIQILTKVLLIPILPQMF